MPKFTVSMPLSQQRIYERYVVEAKNAKAARNKIYDLCNEPELKNYFVDTYEGPLIDLSCLDDRDLIVEEEAANPWINPESPLSDPALQQRLLGGTVKRPD